MLHSSKNQGSFFSALLHIEVVQFLLGGFLSVIFPGFIVFDSGITDWVESPSKFHSVLALFLVYTISFVSIRQFVIYLGRLSFRLAIPVCLFWFALSLLVLFAFRLDYSVVYLASASGFLLAFFSLSRYAISRTYSRTISYIPEGRVDDLPVLKGIVWSPLSRPDVNLCTKETSMVMADLRANLSGEWENFLAQCALRHIPVYHSSRLIEMATGRVKIDHLYENEFGSLLPSRSYQLLKRVLDTVLVLVLMPIVLPIMFITAILIVLESPGGVFFFQERIGQGGVPFTVYKFRSMCSDSEKEGSQFAQANDMRVTKIGRFIRKTRIDELPQFFNVLKGDMALIGPRPEQEVFVKEFNKVIPFYNYRHIVKPGISGWAQVMHGYAANAEDTQVKLEHDLYYIKNFSFSMDLLILFKTIQTVFTGFGAR